MEPAPTRATAASPRSAVPGSTDAEANAPAWLADLEREVQTHPAVQHPLLARFATQPLERQDALLFGLQHHALVGCFTRYMELLLLRAPSSTEKLWLAKVLVDEYGEGSDGRDHATLYAEFLVAAGAHSGEPESTPLCPEVWEFIDTHLQLCREEPYLVGLGALGPGHEWAIPGMFAQIIPGLERAGFTPQERLYFDLHTEQDVDHGAWMTEVLATMVTSEADRQLVRRGARRSLDARARLWSSIERRMTGAASEPLESPGDLRALRPAVNAVVLGNATQLLPASAG
ncbi:MAG: hypothetical protein DHS20C15_06680 [Planctomycetota bacterium]|nr:MAG: hypothetical protein DHS20C15_06680 [Planctomycetota bacterium]